MAASRDLYAGFLEDLKAQWREEGAECHGLGRAPSLELALDQISKDVVRTRPELHFFAKRLDGLSDAEAGDAVQESRAVSASVVLAPKYHYDVLARVLLLYAKLNPGVEYAQGMNELCAPLYYVLAHDPLAYGGGGGGAVHAEADTFFCFSKVMSEMRDVFMEELNNTEEGMLGRVQQYTDVLTASDPELARHLDALAVTPLFYSVRWIMSMLTQDLDMPDVLLAWDALLGDLGGPQPLLHYVCVARVLLIRDELLQGDAAACLRLLQRRGYPPQHSIQDALQLAARLRSGPKQATGFLSRLRSSATSALRRKSK